jgi:3-oxoacyl-[acyl-carrier-protein] synthase III
MTAQEIRVRSKIRGTGAYVPKRVMTNRDLEKTVETSSQWIVDRTGIRERRIAAEGEATSDLAVEAARQALEEAELSAKELDLLIVATCTPDMFLPSTACIVQDRLGARKAVAFDVSAACSGFLYALSVGDQYLRSGVFKTAMIIGAEVMSRITDWSDRSTCILFGDGAGAVVIEARKGPHGILSTHLYSDGRLWDLIYVPGGGSRIPSSSETIGKGLNFMKMKGNETFKVAIRNLEAAAREALAHNHLKESEVALLIPHQANLRILTAVADRLRIPIERVMINIDRFGNTSAASIPMALDEAVRSGRIKEGDILLMEAFGGGLTWASAVIRW